MFPGPYGLNKGYGFGDGDSYGDGYGNVSIHVYDSYENFSVHGYGYGGKFAACYGDLEGNYYAEDNIDTVYLHKRKRRP